MDGTAYLPKHRDEATSAITISVVLAGRGPVKTSNGSSSSGGSGVGMAERQGHEAPADGGENPAARGSVPRWPIHLQAAPPRGTAGPELERIGSSPVGGAADGGEGGAATAEAQAPPPRTLPLGEGDCLFFNGRAFVHWRDYADGYPAGPDRCATPSDMGTCPPPPRPSLRARAPLTDSSACPWRVLCHPAEPPRRAAHPPQPTRSSRCCCCTTWTPPSRWRTARQWRRAPRPQAAAAAARCAHCRSPGARTRQQTAVAAAAAAATPLPLP
eukprot:COSAG01_NODE_387_length_17738_cov_14.410171_4_plen_271_part_00